VTATNVYGESLASPQGNGATIVLIPDAVILLKDDVSETSASVIGIEWTNGVS
jgi:hypothetical protein